ncbi:class I SAM-dependent methyltransferase [Anaeromicropila herbilytica]|uniref:S-adenosylmethionine-dependent methyltransferase n=1 Tax=Anaeromicropila herbilytica TaxID=2785025 RepID=A0A7R7IDG9_9FIRM|nr:class I SAM-dependent methyltransferase [Anaeromicropila herbilytica]BCN30936.1 S-adenosylmethionine-dependent methyltransferase [Anaeromicropila herbilytica]
MTIPNLDKLHPWEALLKKIALSQLGNINGLKILDFGSGNGFTANYFAQNNDVIAIEPSEDAVKDRFSDNNYQQIVGSIDELRKMEDESFDIILCHNVLEYADNRESIINEFYRLLKLDGKLSVIKHNRHGRVMQMVVLLNDFEKAHMLLDGKDSTASKYGTIHYYRDIDLISWCKDFNISETYGIRSFWDLQQNQEIQKDTEWQDKMVDIEMRVAKMKEFQDIAFFHHLILMKEFIPLNRII